MRRKSLLLLVIFSAVILSGCAPKMMVKDGPLDKGQPIDLMVRPHQSLGVQVTDAIEKGQVTTVFGTPSDKLLSEDYPGRIRWNVLAELNGQEIFGQAVRYGMYDNGKFIYAVMLDKKDPGMKNAKALILSSCLHFVCDLEGNAFRVEPQKINEKTYRLELVRRFGTRIGKLPVAAQDFSATVRSWNRYELKREKMDMYSPFGAKDIQDIAAINPGYGLGERIVSKGNIRLTTSPVTTVASIAMSVIKAMGAKSEGWDYMSQLPTRETMAMIIEYTGRFRLELIQDLNAKLKASQISLVKQAKKGD